MLRATGGVSALGQWRVRETFQEEKPFKLSPEREYDLALRREGRKWKGGSLRRYKYPWDSNEVSSCHFHLRVKEGALCQEEASRHKLPQRVEHLSFSQGLSFSHGLCWLLREALAFFSIYH